MIQYAANRQTLDVSRNGFAYESDTVDSIKMRLHSALDRAQLFSNLEDRLFNQGHDTRTQKYLNLDHIHNSHIEELRAYDPKLSCKENNEKTNVHSSRPPEITSLSKVTRISISRQELL